MSEGQRNYRGKLRSDYQTVNDEPSMTVQSDAADADIMTILAQYTEVGVVQQLNETQLQFGDISEFTDFADAQRQLKEVEADFMRLPSKVRAIFHHDVAEFLDTAHDQEKRDALVSAGLLEAPVVIPEVVPPVSGGDGAAGVDPGGDGAV